MLSDVVEEYSNEFAKGGFVGLLGKGWGREKRNLFIYLFLERSKIIFKWSREINIEADVCVYLLK